MTRFLAQTGSLSLLVVVLAGCGNGRSAVRGKVHFPDGTPLDQGRVLLSSITGSHGASSGPLAKDGSFVLGSLAVADGVPPGQYKVSIFGAYIPVTNDTDKLKPPIALIDPRFADSARSGITVEVKPTNDNFLDITVEKPPSGTNR